MLSLVDMKGRKSTSGSWPPNVGSDGETRFLQEEGHTQETLSNWTPVMHNCEL
jgi:hypothetical protein